MFMLDMTLLNQIESVLPESLCSNWEELKAETVENPEKLTVCLLGAFSVGKSSLINMLVGKEYLAVAQQETTALPTFIEYAETEHFLLQKHDGTMQAVSLETFQKETTAQSGAWNFASLGLPLNWLKELYLVDLPGLGSLSEQHQEYTRAQVRTADIILYLLQPRGPDAEDLKMLQFIASLGKPVKILIAQWDLVLESVKMGEKMPSLEKWASQIQEVTGELAVLLPVSKTGIGRNSVLDYFELIQMDLESIRTKRFYAETVLLLETALERVSEQKKLLADDLVVRDQSHKEALLQKRTEMLEIKKQIHDQLQQEQRQIEQRWQKYAALEKDKLIQKLEEFKETLLAEPASKQSWQAFIQKGHACFEVQTRDLATEASVIAKQYGKIELPALAKKQLNVRFPEIEKIEQNDFTQSGRMEVLKEEFASVTAELEKLVQEKQSDVTEQTDSALEQYRHEIKQLEEVKKELMSRQIPKVEHVVMQGSNVGSTLGRTMGAIVDIGLMFVAPQTIGTKVASIFGKGATAVSIAKKVTAGATLLQKAKTGSDVVGKVAQKAGILQMLSAEYWGERLGGVFDRPPQVESVVDLQAMTEMEIEKQNIMAQIQERKHMLQNLERQRQQQESNEFIQKQQEQRAAILKKQIEEREFELKQQQEQAAQEAQQRQQVLFSNQVTQAIAQWVGQFEHYASGIESQLFYLFKVYAESQVENALATYEEHLVSLEESLKRSPQEKQAAEIALTEQIKQLTQFQQDCQKYASLTL